MPTTTSRHARPSMGYQPGLDGLRAISVVAVIFYHAGFGWMHGGFFGVEVFFVVSGYLITTLLIEERAKTGQVSLRQFWVRRVRRLFPALFAMLLAVAVWTAQFGTAEQTSRLRRDLPWSIFYVNNWGQVVGEVPYFQPGDPPLLRHLWSLAVEEQWYVVWPLVFTFVLARWRPRDAVRVLLAVVVLVSVLMWWVQRGSPAALDGPIGFLDGADRVNFNYLSTITRSGGLLLGAAAAFVWQPWKSERAFAAPLRGLDIAAGLGLGVLFCAFFAASLTEGYLYPWLLTLVSAVSLVLVMIVVHPAAAGTRWVLSQPLLVEAGKRSYGWYLWHWPIFVVIGATDASWSRFVVATVVWLAVAEASYRFVEEPVRGGALSRWFRAQRSFPVVPAAVSCIVVFGLAVFYWQVDEFDVAAGGDDVAFELSPPSDSLDPASVASSDAAAPAAGSIEPVAADSAGADPQDPSAVPVASIPASTATTTTTTTTLAPLVLPRRIAIVGDSQAHSLAVNLPSGIGDTFAISDASSDGCSVYDNGRVVSARESFSNNFSICAGWAGKWAGAASGADVVLVVLGAWDVFDLVLDSGAYTFGTPEWDAVFVSNLSVGLDAMAGSSAHVALLEVACMRPVEAKGAGVPPLPERADDARVAHVNGLLRSVADARPQVTFVNGPTEWCSDPTIATDLGYRWDGVHVYKPGAKLIYETIAADLLVLGR